MIPAQLLHRLVDSIIDHATGIELEEAPAPTTKHNLDRLIDFAREHRLDAEDMATLFRVAAGEGAYDPVIRRDSFDDDPGIIRRPLPKA